MPPSLELLYADTVFRLSRLGWLGFLDLLLVAIVIYLMLRLIRRSQAALLLRGALVSGLVLLVITILLPLPTFDWLVRGALLVILVATPVVLQPELRRVLERIGRSTGLSRVVRQTTVESVLPRLLRTVETLSHGRTGALIVLEGEVPLDSYVDSGVTVDSPVTGELLLTIFHDKTPLHDGAVILRRDRIAAASCVLPLTEQDILSYRRLGTRHRAAVGMSEVSDAIVIVVSEETGHVSIAHEGRLQQRLESTELRQQIFNFLTREAAGPPPLSLRRLINQAGAWLRPDICKPSLRQVTITLITLLVTAVLTLAIWSFVIEQTNPTERPQIDNIELHVEDTPEGMTLMTTPPATVAAEVRTTAEIRPSLQAENFQATVSLQDLPPGVHRVPVVVDTGAPLVQVVAVEPAAVTLELARIVTQTMPVTVDLPDQQGLSAAYEVTGRPLVTPAEVQVTGPAPLVEQVAQVQATILATNASSTIREVRPLRALDEQGSEVAGVTLEPAQAQVTVVITRRQNARDVGVRAVTVGAPPDGYWLSGLSVTPANMTLRGQPAALDQLNGFVNTLPVDVSEVRGELNMQVPLDLPPEITAIDSSGAPIRAVMVHIQTSARSGDLLLSKTIEVFGAGEAMTVSVEPRQIDVLLSGPLPTLNEIRANLMLVQLMVDVSGLAPGQSRQVEPQYIAPEGLSVQFIPATVLVTVTE